MQDTELFLSLAEIAGVFVGFGALIAVRSAVPGNTIEVASIGMMVLFAVVIVAVALAPVVVSGFGMDGHGLWLVCSVIALAALVGAMLALDRIPGEAAAFRAARAPLRARAQVEAVGLALWGPAVLAFVLIVFGPFPEQEAALYFAALALLLLADAGFLLLIVFRVGLPRVPEPGPEAAVGATGTKG